MATFVKGDIIVVPFPFTDFTKIKRRRALVIANLRGNDVILCQITSQNITDIYAITLTNDEFITGSLNQNSNIRPNKLFTADSQIISYKIGQLKPEKITEITQKIIHILESIIP